MPTLADQERSYLISALGLTVIGAANMTLADLQQAFYLQGGASAKDNQAGGHTVLAWPTTGIGATSPSTSFFIMAPMRPEKKFKFSTVSIEVLTAVAASGVRAGIYTIADSTATLVADFGTFDSTTIGLKTSGVLDITLDAQTYWFGCTGQGAGGVSVRGAVPDYTGPVPQLVSTQLNDNGVYIPVDSSVLNTPLPASKPLPSAGLASSIPRFRFNSVTYP